jgi:catechol 2,3-dioxygenase-like lactoylglutathione lyase family enzyme
MENTGMHMDHINLVVRDLDRMRSFFQRLGFEVEARDRLSGLWISRIVGLEGVEAEYVKLVLPGDRVRLELIRYDQPAYHDGEGTGEAHQPGFRHLAFEVDDLDAQVKALSDAGVDWVGHPETYAQTGKRLVYFRGPENVLLELAQYPDT